MSTTYHCQMSVCFIAVPFTTFSLYQFCPSVMTVGFACGASRTELFVLLLNSLHFTDKEIYGEMATIKICLTMERYCKAGW